MVFAAASTTCLASPSTITRSRGSVPEGRSSTRPLPSSDFSAAACAAAIAPAAAVLGEKADERTHVLEIGAVDDEAPVLAAVRQAGARQTGKVKGQRRRRQTQRFANGTGGHSCRTRPDQQAKRSEP